MGPGELSLSRVSPAKHPMAEPSGGGAKSSPSLLWQESMRHIYFHGEAFGQQSKWKGKDEANEG